MLLEGKNAVVHGGGGAIGGAVARGFARDGARVFLAGRTLASLEEVAGAIRAAGGSADTAQVDALDGEAVNAHTDAVVAEAGSLDICMNVITHGDVQGTPMVEMPVEDYLGPVETAVRTTFLTSTAAGRHMRTGGVPETIPEGTDGREAIVADIEKQTMLGRTAALEDVGNVAAFVASDRARTMTAATATISCGA